MATLRNRGWSLFDQIIETADLADVNPWQHDEAGAARFNPDYTTLSRLLGVPVYLGASSQSGVPALALDVWVAYELRRAGFDPERVWPRARKPRVLPYEIHQFVEGLPAKLKRELHQRIATAKQVPGTASSANLLGKNYVKQVDVVMSSWSTGPELMISTKRMDSSFGKNAANRVEESYGDAKNLRLRHPQAALGFVYALNAVALVKEHDKALWLIDLLEKLGREDDAYDAVALILPDLAGHEDDGPEELDEAGPLEAGAVEDEDEQEGEAPASVEDDVAQVIPVSLAMDDIPPALDPGAFFATMCSRILDNTPITFHTEARARRGAPHTATPS